MQRTMRLFVGEHSLEILCFQSVALSHLLLSWASVCDKDFLENAVL